MYCEPHLSKQRQLWTAGHAEVSISQWRCFFHFFLLYFGEESGQVQKGDLGCWARALVVVIFTIVVLASSSFSITRHAIRSRVRLTLNFQSVLWLSLCPCWFNSLLFHTSPARNTLLCFSSTSQAAARPKGLRKTCCCCPVCCGTFCSHKCETQNWLHIAF